MSALDSSGVSRMLDVRPTYMCPVGTCHFHCYARLELLEHFRNEHVTKKSLLQSVTATTAAVEGSISKLSTDSLRTLMGVTKLPTPDPLSALLEEEEGIGMDEVAGHTPYIESLLKLADDDSNTIVVSLPPPEEGIVGGSAEDHPFNEFVHWLFADWTMDDEDSNGEEDGGAGPLPPPATLGAAEDHEDEFERWIGCNHRLIYHYDHYVTARENIFLPCTIRGVRLMKDGQKVSMVVPEVMRPMKPKHIKSVQSWKLNREHAEVRVATHTSVCVVLLSRVDLDWGACHACGHVMCGWCASMMQADLAVYAMYRCQLTNVLVHTTPSTLFTVGTVPCVRPYRSLWSHTTTTFLMKTRLPSSAPNLSHTKARERWRGVRPWRLAACRGDSWSTRTATRRRTRVNTRRCFWKSTRATTLPSSHIGSALFILSSIFCPPRFDILTRRRQRIALHLRA